MKIQKKVILLIAAIVGVFAAFLILYARSEIRWIDALVNARVEEQKRFFDEVVELKGSSLKAHTSDYTFWDDMVSFVEKRDAAWAAKNIDPSLDSFKDNAAWIYDTNFSLVYSFNNMGASDLADLPVPKEAMADIFSKSRFCHFFINTSKGLIEIRGATIQPTSDYMRKTPPRGYFFAGLVWDREFMNDFPRILDGSVELTPEEKVSSGAEPMPFGTISFSKPLAGWDGKPVMYSLVETQSATLRELYYSFRNQLIIFIVFSVGVSGLLLFFLLRWVNIPLKRISLAMSEGDPSQIKDLQTEDTEHGHIARLVEGFFEQKARFDKEMEQRAQMEEEMRRLSADLEEMRRTLEERVEKRSEEFKRTQEKVVRTEKFDLLGKLASTVSHDIRTPLTAIKNAAYLLRMQGVGDGNPQQGEIISLIEREVNSCTQIMGNMLGFLKPKEPVKGETDMPELIHQSLSVSIVPASIRVTTQFEENLPKVNADESQLRHLFINMIRNAIEAMPGGGKLKIGVELRGAEEVVTFEDTGIGIPHENIRRIFDPMFSTFPKGSGLGLSVCQQIIEAHGGSIEVESEMGSGTTFKVRIPVR